MMGLDTTISSLLELRKQLPQFPTRQLGEDFGIAGPFNQCREHIPPTFAQHIGCSRGQLAIGGFQPFLPTIDLSRTLLH
jgi:hypothetical protein